MSRFIILTLTVTFIGSLASLTFAEQPVDFNRDIRPLLSDKCYACHGPDDEERQGGFRLDIQKSALGEADSGEYPIVPGRPDSSELLRRIISDDDDLRMPPADSNKSLSADEIALIGRWIEQGAPWKEHWAFVPPQRPNLPELKDAAWCRNEIDQFILARLEQEGLGPTREADKATLIRRVTFDLTGLPPTIAQVDAILADHDDKAYEKVVDRLLKSPRFGEHMARFWLDASRYGDTHGLHLDNYREMWPYRDWVVKAFNDNMPYDQFAVEQLAGDLLPEPSLDQLVATGFNRCHVTTNEGGSIVEEVYVRNVIDRVVTMGTVFLGLTMECSRCHDHKYDPLTMRDFYSMFAFFNSIDGKAMDGNAAQHPPVVKVPTEEQSSQIKQLELRRKKIESEIAAAVALVQYDDSVDQDVPETTERREFVWIDDDVPAGAELFADGAEDNAWTYTDETGPIFSGSRASKRTAKGRSQHYFQKADSALRVGKDDKLFTYVYLDAEDPPKQIMLQWNTGDWNHRAFWGENLIDWGKDGSPQRRHIGPLPETGKWVRLEIDCAHVGINPGAVINGWAFAQFDGTVYWDKSGIISEIPQNGQPMQRLSSWLVLQKATEGAGLPKDILEIVNLDSSKRSEDQQRKLRDYFIEHAYQETRDKFAPLHERLSKVNLQLKEADKSVGTTLIFRERKEPRPAYFLNRGEYDQRGDEVGRSTPAFLPAMPEGLPLNRLGLAQWVVDASNPLTARVAVNRFWLQVFGTGIVKTAEDFGSQGEVPSHPELLDWLALQFMDDGWDIKKMMKRIVMSATYRQSSHVTPELVARDPRNRLLARGPRFRLDAETLRDQALHVSGLMVEQMGGPSVKPPQPDGLWFAVGYSGSNTVRFKQDTGRDKVHRRTLYTFIKRTAPPPQMSTFDAPSREACTVRRERTNTPLQALLLMNDPQFVEAARALAERTIREGGSSVETRVTFMFRLCAARKPSDNELNELVNVFRDHLKTFEGSTDSARQLIAVGETNAQSDMAVQELAAWTMVANLVLNLDEVVTKN